MVCVPVPFLSQIPEVVLVQSPSYVSPFGNINLILYTSDEVDGDVKDRLSRLCDSPRLASSAGWRELGSRTERASVAGATGRPLTRKQKCKKPIRRHLGGAAAAGEVQEGS